MATDYDAPRKHDDEPEADSIEELTSRQKDQSSAAIEEDENEAAEGFELPGADLSREELSVIGQISQDFARGTADITDRQNIQLHWVRIEDVPELWRRLEEVGLTTIEGCGDTPRGFLVSPVAGACARGRGSGGSGAGGRRVVALDGCVPGGLPGGAGRVCRRVRGCWGCRGGGLGARGRVGESDAECGAAH